MAHRRRHHHHYHNHHHAFHHAGQEVTHHAGHRQAAPRASRHYGALNQSAAPSNSYPPQSQSANPIDDFFNNVFGQHNQEQAQQTPSPQAGRSRRDLKAGTENARSPVSGFQTPDQRTAVYSIETGKVYLPNGDELEAHSGLGPYFDKADPQHVSKKMQGSTPPGVYKLSLRESPFHGVQALRLTPISGNIYGRNGLLAHTFMLGQRGDSNGCVSFRNYNQFLQAHMDGVDKLMVVPRAYSHQLAQNPSAQASENKSQQPRPVHHHHQPAV